jgi:3'-phosphoadenosine 5'-phosphosulfate sulfotransferase (PAPS reductase)/FAD synthetase
MSYEDKLKWSRELAAKVIKDYDPYAVIVGYTSGGDSNVALKLATMLFKVDAAFTCDTSIAAIETLTHCHKITTENYGLKHICRLPPYNGVKENPDTYAEIVKRHGFPGHTKTAHNWMFRWLKDHTIMSIVSNIRKNKRNRNIVIVSGARKHESKRRWGTSKDITINGSNIWVNIVNDWTDQDMYEFSAENNLDFLRGPISKLMGFSGDCFCGSHAEKGELNFVRVASPSTHEKLMFLQEWVFENTENKWGWEDGPLTKEQKKSAQRAEQRGRQFNLFTPNMLMCSSCMNNPSYDPSNDEIPGDLT